MVGAPDLRQAVVSAVADGCRLLILDISELDFVDSFGLGAVVGALKRLRQRGGELALVCPSRRIRRVFEICDCRLLIDISERRRRAEAVAPARRRAGAVCPSRRIRRVFEICDLDRILALHDSIDSASGSPAVSTAAPSASVTS